MARIHFSIAMSLCQSIRILQWVPTSIKDWCVLRCCNHCIWLTLIGNMQAAERFTAFCTDYREILFFPPEEVPIRFAPFQTWWNPVELCVWVCVWGGGYNGAKSTLRQITTTITITLTIFILLMHHLVRVQGTKVGAGRGHPMPNLCKPW